MKLALFWEKKCQNLRIYVKETIGLLQEKKSSNQWHWNEHG
jgi:hypothetical protein